MVAIAIISLFIIYLLPTTIQNDPKPEIAQADLQTILTNLVRYHIYTGNLPTTEQGLRALVIKPTSPPTPERWKQMTLAKYLLDPWNQPYRYRLEEINSSQSITIWSFGSDNIDGTQDDITITEGF